MRPLPGGDAEPVFDQPHYPEAVEAVEFVPVAEATSAATGPGGTGPPGGRPPGRRGGFGGSSRWLWLLVAVGLVAVVAVIVVQRGGSDPNVADTNSTTVTSTESAAPHTPSSALPGTDPSSPVPATASSGVPDPGGAATSAAVPSTAPSSPAPERTGTVTVLLGPGETTRVSVPGSPQATGRPTVTTLPPNQLGVTGDWELVGYGWQGVVRLRLGTGEMTVTPVPPLGSGGPVSVLATGSGVIVRPLDNVSGYLIPDDGPARPLTGLLDGGGVALPGPDPAHLWVASPQGQGSDEATELRLVDLRGRPAGQRIGLPPDLAAAGSRPDGAGYALVSGVGGVYRAEPSGVHLVTHGMVLAAGRTAFLAYQCDEQARCSTVIIDRPSGQTRVLSDVHFAAPYALGGLMTDDGATAAVVEVAIGSGGGGYSYRLHLVDVTAGTERVFGPDEVLLNEQYFGQASMPIAFSPDGRLLLVAGVRGLNAIDTATDEVTALPESIPGLEVLDVRPAPSS